MVSYVYRQTEKSPPLWTVGFYEGDEWFPESDHSDPDEAADRVHWLSGGGGADPEPDLFTSPVGLAVGPEGNPLLVCADGSVWTSGLEEEWRELLPIPGTERAHELDVGELEAGELEDPDFDQLDLEDELDDLEEDELEEDLPEEQSRSGREYGSYAGGEI